jgi:hypothetical protein
VSQPVRAVVWPCLLKQEKFRFQPVRGVDVYAAQCSADPFPIPQLQLSDVQVCEWRGCSVRLLENRLPHPTRFTQIPFPTPCTLSRTGHTGQGRQKGHAQRRVSGDESLRPGLRIDLPPVSAPVAAAEARQIANSCAVTCTADDDACTCGQIPAINDNGFKLGESMAIMSYLAETRGWTDLWPSHPQVCLLALYCACETINKL